MKGMLSFVEYEKHDYKREWEKRICMMPWQQENSDVVQVRERLQMKAKELTIYFLKTMFCSMSLGVTSRYMHTSVEATDTETRRWEKQGQWKQEGANQTDQFRQEAEVWTYFQANEVIANEPSERWYGALSYFLPPSGSLKVGPTSSDGRPEGSWQGSEREHGLIQLFI